MEKIEIEEEEAREPIPGEYGHPIPREIMFRELGFTEPYSRFSVGRRVVSSTLATKAVHTLCTKETVNRRKFKLPAGARTTFHMAFSADGTKLASCHGDHNVYVCDVRNGEVLQTLSGHPRTPWCVVFHPTQNDILASGCLAGHIRVWDLNGGSEVLVTDSGTVIASLAFHPTVRLLAIATFNEIIFWDWGLSYPLARCSTENTKEKVRLVRFDRLGKSLITGITNFPNPPVREGLQAPTASANHRPNILSRGNSRAGTVNFFVHERAEMNDPRDGPVDVTDDPEDRGNDPHSHGEILAASLAAAAEAEAASAVFNRRQDRFQESYRQLVNHYQDLVSHYQQFLRSRIPRLLETSRIVREQPGQPASDVQNPTPPVVAETDVTMSEVSGQTESPIQGENPTPVDDELPGPSRLIQLEARLLEIINTPESSSSDSASQGSTTTATTENSSIPSRLRNDTDLRNIEMLAQNILEMQNLCSQARRDAPLTIETQHIIELQNIRRHLELLQEQTRELQSSIRATLTSLARGSLDALRSHVTNNPSHTSSLTSLARGSLDALRSHVAPTNTNPAPTFPPSSTAASSHGNARSSSMGPSNQSSPGNSNAILRITIGPRLTASAELIPPSNTSGSSSGPTRTQVPPAITMQYELPDGTSRGPTSISLGSMGEPIPGTSRGSARGSGDPSSTGPRRIIREFHVVSGRGAGDMEQHARNCPFSGRDQPQRPPPRMRCMTEMGETPTLTVWPTIETGMELETRNFRSVNPGREILRQSDSRVMPIIQDPRVSVESFGNNLSNSYPNNPPNTLASSYFNQGYLGGPNWISNDVGVHVFLTIRRVADTVRRNGSILSTESSDLESENWQRLFPAGFAFINQLARQGNRPDRRSQGREVPRGLFSCRVPRHRSESNYNYGRPGIWDDLLRSSSTSQFLPSTSCASTSSSSSATPTAATSSGPSQSSRNVGRQLPPRINGNFVLIYYMRAGEEVIPVYSVRPENHDFNETVAMREGPLLNVFVFPIGLFLRGSSWENGAQTVGIYWPPVSRDEEQSLLDFRRSDALVPVYTTNLREPSAIQRSENLASSRYQITYDSDQMQLILPGGSSIVIVQPGLLVLDAVTTAANFDRPRSVEGILYIDQISPILESLERLFGFRQRNQILSSATINSSPSPSRPPMHPGWVRPPHNPYRGWINSSNVSNQRQFPDGAEPVIVRHGGMNGMLVRRNGSEPSFVPIYTPGEARVGLERVDRASNERTRRTAPDEEDSNPPPRSGSGSGSANSGTSSNGGPSRSPWPTTGSRSSMPEHLNPPFDNEGGSEGMSSTRRVIRLAVDTATADILRRDHQQNARGNITRAIESRIERVLNERGNRGIPENPPSYVNSMVYLPVSSINWNNNFSQDNNEAYLQDRQLRLEDIQLRISMLTQWSQQSRQPSTSVTSGTQTNASFLQSSSQASSSTAASNTINSTPSAPLAPPAEVTASPAATARDSPLRTSRRRPYPRTQVSAAVTTSGPATFLDDDSLPSPSRIPRLSSPVPVEFSSEAAETTEVSEELAPGFTSRVWNPGTTSSTSTPQPLESLLNQEGLDFLDPAMETRRRRINTSAAAGSDNLHESVSESMREIPLVARPENPLLQTIAMGANDDVDIPDRVPPLINILGPTTPLPSSHTSHPLNDPSPPPPVVELDPGRLNLTAEERAQDLDEIWRNSVRLARNMVQEDRDTANNRPGNPNDLETAFTRLINSLDGMPASEPLLLRLRDVLTPVEVSRIEGARRSVLPTVELSPEIDEIEGERESQLFVGSAVPFDNNGFTTGTAPPPSRDYWTRDEIVNVEQSGYDQGVPRTANIGDADLQNLRSSSSSGSENNPLLQTVGEATAREAITSMELTPQESPMIPPDSALSRTGNEGSDTPPDIHPPMDLNEPIPSAPFPFPYHGLSNEESHRRVVAYIDSIEREIATRETVRSAASIARNLASSRPGYPLLRTIDEATARNAVSSVLNFQTEASLGADPSLQPEVDASPPYSNQNFPRQPEGPAGARNEGPGHARRRQEVATGGRSSRSRIPPSISTHFGEWLLRRHRSSPSQARVRVTVRGGDSSSAASSAGSHELSGSARTRLGLSSGIGSSGPTRLLASNSRNSTTGNNGSSSASNSNDQRQRPSTSSYVPLPHPQVYRHPHHAAGVSNSNFSNNNNNNSNNNGGEEPIISDSGARFYPGYIPEILITPRARPPTYYTMDAATTAFLSSRIQKWDFSDFYIPDITDRTSGLITASCSLHSDATLDVSSDSEFIAVLQPSDNGSYSAVGIYSLRDETLGASLYTYHFDQNTVSVSISPSCDYVVVGYAGRGPFYRIVHPSRNIGQILSLTREGPHVKLVPVKELFADTQPTLMSINCMHWVPIPGYGIIYGTNTGEVVLLS